MNLFAVDAKVLKTKYGLGWSGKVRALVRDYLNKLEREKANVQPRRRLP
jgi:hypothetical protein